MCRHVCEDDVLFLLGDEQQVGENIQIELFCVGHRPQQLGVTRLNVRQRSSLNDIAITGHQRHRLQQMHVPTMIDWFTVLRCSILLLHKMRLFQTIFQANHFAGYRKKQCKRVQALANILCSPLCWHVHRLQIYVELCCHSNETLAPIANLPNSAQLQGTPYHSLKLHLDPCSSVGMRWGTDRQIHWHTDTHKDGHGHYTFCVVYNSHEMKLVLSRTPWALIFSHTIHCI